MNTAFEKYYAVEYTKTNDYTFDKRFPEAVPIMKMIITVSQFSEKVRDGKIQLLNSPMTPSDFNLFQIEKLRKIISVLKEHQKNINFPDCEGDTCLHAAAHMHNMDEDVFEQLLKHGADVRRRNMRGETPLHKAAEIACRSDIMRALLKYGGNPNVQNCIKETPLHIASFPTPFCRTAQCDHSDTIKELLDNGARVDINNDILQNVLHTYLEDRDCSLYIVQRYLEKNPTLVNSQDENKSTPLHYAIINSVDINIIKELLNRGADVNARDSYCKTPLHYVPIDYSEEEFFEVIKALLKKGADINATEIDGWTPLYFAVRFECYKIAKRLILLGAKDIVGRKTVDKSRSILGEAVHDLRELAIIYNPNRTLPLPFYTLSLSSCDATYCQEPLELIKLILENGADPDTGNCGQEELECEDLKIPLVDKLLVQYRVLKSCKILLNEGTNDKEIALRIKGRTPFDLNVSHKPFIVEWMDFRDECITEILMMRKDILCKRFTVYQFVSERCSVLNASKVTNVILDKFLFKISNNCYPNCKDILFAAIKWDDVLNRLLKLQIFVYKTDAEKVTLDYDSVDNLARYLSKVDLINLILAFYTQSEKSKHSLCMKRKYEANSDLNVNKLLKVPSRNNF